MMRSSAPKDLSAHEKAEIALLIQTFWASGGECYLLDDSRDTDEERISKALKAWNLHALKRHLSTEHHYDG